MHISDALAEARELTGFAVADATMCRWLSELDGRVALETFHADTAEPYTSPADELLIPFPWDGGVYVPYLEAMLSFSAGEYERYANARALAERTLDDYRRYCRRRGLIRTKEES